MTPAERFWHRDSQRNHAEQHHLARVGRGVAEHRRTLEATCEARQGKITSHHAHAIALAAECFQAGAIARWCMRQPGTSSADMLKASEVIVRAGEARNRAVARLELDLLRALHTDGSARLQSNGDPVSGMVAALAAGFATSHDC